MTRYDHRIFAHPPIEPQVDGEPGHVDGEPPAGLEAVVEAEHAAAAGVDRRRRQQQVGHQAHGEDGHHASLAQL